MSNPTTKTEFEIDSSEMFDADLARENPELTGKGYFEIESDSWAGGTGYLLKQPMVSLHFQLTNLAETGLEHLVDSHQYVKVRIQHVPNDYGAETFARGSQVKIVNVVG
jgi:hypothetical protein